MFVTSDEAGTRLGPVSAVAFDCDGTLVDSESVWLDTVAHVIGGYGISVPTMEQFRGVTARQAAASIAELTGRALVDVQVHLNEMYSVGLTEIRSALPGAVNFVASLAATVPVVVVSNGRHDDVVALLEATRLDQYVSAVLTIEDVSRGKPSPDLYAAAASKFYASPESVVVIEDSDAGASAGIAAGCEVVGIGPAISPHCAVTARVASYAELSFEENPPTIAVRGGMS